MYLTGDNSGLITNITLIKVDKGYILVYLDIQTEL